MEKGQRVKFLGFKKQDVRDVLADAESYEKEFGHKPPSVGEHGTVTALVKDNGFSSDWVEVKFDGGSEAAYPPDELEVVEIIAEPAREISD